MVLTQIGKGNPVTRARLEEAFEVSAKTAKRDLSDLVKRGLIEYISKSLSRFLPSQDIDKSRHLPPDPIRYKQIVLGFFEEEGSEWSDYRRGRFKVLAVRPTIVQSSSCEQTPVS